jgi:dTDP-glucose 4,6-dehydratase
MQYKPLSRQDLSEILQQSKIDLFHLKSKKIFVTGGTGFIGKWLTQALIEANKIFELELEMVLLTRSADSAKQMSPWLQQKFIRFVEGDVKNFVFPDEKFDVIIHGAVAASAKLNAENPEEMVRTCTEGMFHTLKFAELCEAKTFLLLSSGAVYGKQPAEITHVNETANFGPDILNPGCAYHEGKRMSELLGAIWSKRSGADFKIARCFAFVGPYLPLDTHFAVGNFILDCLNGKSIEIKGDGTNFRSILYGTDMIVWLLKILINGKSCRAYNVGSERDISIKEMAELVDRASIEFYPERVKNNNRVIIYGKLVPGSAVERYVPSVDRIKAELGVTVGVELEDGLRRTFAWYRNEA